MVSEASREALAKIEQQFLAADSTLSWNTALELADFTVAFITSEDGELRPAGTGTLVSFFDSHYFLTAGHVWENSLRKSASIRIPLRENTRCRFSINSNEIVPSACPVRQSGTNGDLICAFCGFLLTV